MYVLDAANGHELASQCFDPRNGGSCAGSGQVIEIESSPAIVPNEGNGQQARIYVGVDYNEGNPGRGGMVKLTLTHQPIGDTWALHADWKFDPEKLGTWTGTEVFTAGNPVRTGCLTAQTPTAVPARRVFSLTHQ